MVKPIKPSKVKAIKPSEVFDAKIIPDEIITATNTLIAKEWDGRSAIVKQDEILNEAMRLFKAAGNKITREQIFDNGYMDIEEAFRKAGWYVYYDKPGHNEDYDASFTFKKK